MDDKDEILKALEKAEREGDELLARKRAAEERIKKHVPPPVPEKKEKEEHLSVIEAREQKRQWKEFFEVVALWLFGLFLLICLLKSELEKFVK